MCEYKEKIELQNVLEQFVKVLLFVSVNDVLIYFLDQYSINSTTSSFGFL